MIKETITFTFENDAQQRRFHDELKNGRHRFVRPHHHEARDFGCAARRQGTAGGNDPAECDWPSCGCDDYAAHVMFSLHEQGWRSPDEVEAYARKTREQVIREFNADKE